MHFHPTQEQENWIKAKLERGEYANASEVISKAIDEKMERERRREAKLQDLKAAIEEGDKGPSIPLDIEQIIREAEEEAKAEQENA